MVEAALKEAGVGGDEVDELIVGNCTAGDNPARLIALASGLSVTAMATTVDQQCASGLEAILAAARRIAAGEASIVVAGGAEALSTAPWRIAKPRNLFQTPHFIRSDPFDGAAMAEHVPHNSCEALAQRHEISRELQDTWTLASHAKAAKARDARRFVGEIVPLRSTPEEARDQSAGAPDPDELADLEPICGDHGTLTTGNTSTLHDGAAFVVAVSEAEWKRLGRPPALRPTLNAALGVEPGQEAEAPIAALNKLYGRMNGLDRSTITAFELSEASAAQVIALCRQLAIDEAVGQSGRWRGCAWPSARRIGRGAGGASFFPPCAPRGKARHPLRSGRSRRQRWPGFGGAVRARLAGFDHTVASLPAHASPNLGVKMSTSLVNVTVRATCTRVPG